jgi:hypothetical protein
MVGFLGGDALNWASWTNAFAQRMREIGWTENRTVAVEYRWVEVHLAMTGQLVLSVIYSRQQAESRALR